MIIKPTFNLVVGCVMLLVAEAAVGWLSSQPPVLSGKGWVMELPFVASTLPSVEHAHLLLKSGQSLLGPWGWRQK